MEEKRQVSFRIPEPLYRRLKIVLARDGRRQEEILAGMVEAWIRKKEGETDE